MKVPSAPTVSRMESGLMPVASVSCTVILAKRGTANPPSGGYWLAMVGGCSSSSRTWKKRALPVVWKGICCAGPLAVAGKPGEVDQDCRLVDCRTS